MRALITGGAGFIGAHVAQALQDRGDAVTVLDNFVDYYDPALKRARIRALLRRDTPVRECDIADAGPLADVLRAVKPQIVIHLAAWPGVRPSQEYPTLYTTANVTGTVNVFHACAKTGVERVLFASSSTVYGVGVPLPWREDTLGVTAQSVYGATKRCGEAYARVYHAVEHLRVTCLRFFTAYGPWGRPDMAYWRFAERILRGEPLVLFTKSVNGEEVKRDFTEISDIVQGVLAAVDRNLPFAAVNLGRAEPVPLRRFVRALEQALGKTAIIEERVLPPHEEVQTGADLTNAHALLGYAPRVSVEEGIQRFATWYVQEFLPAFPSGLAPSKYWT